MSLHDDRLFPWWLERQLDPSSPDAIPGPGGFRNSTHRNWALLGTVGGPERAVIDPRGLITPVFGGWSLDWWVGADDAWHLPSRTHGMRQALVEDSPVVETTMRIPSGELVHRAWAVAAGGGVPSGGAVIVELTNSSPVPVALALAIRPFGPTGIVPISAIDLDGTSVIVDGRVAMILPKLPSRHATGSERTGDSLRPTLDGTATNAWPVGGVTCESGSASATMIFPLPHTATLRVMLPLVPEAASSGTTAVATTVEPAAAPESARVISGWEAQSRRAPRLEFPDRKFSPALVSSQRFALLHAAGDDAGSWPPAPVGGLDTTEICVALDQHGFHLEAERILLGFADRQRLDGMFEGEADRTDSPGAWLHAVAEHIRLSGDPSIAEVLVGPVAKAAHALRRRQSGRRFTRRSGGELFPTGTGPSWAAEGEDRRAHDIEWALRGFLDAAFVLEIAGQNDAAAEVASFATSLAEAVALSPSVTTIEPVLVKGGVWHESGNAGLSPRRTAMLGMQRLDDGDVSAFDQLSWLLDTGAPLATWPEFVHPRTGGGCGGDGHHGPSTAAFLRLARTLAVIERPDGLHVLPVVPDAWFGQSIEIHDLPTQHGLLSLAVRWHGERPAVLWDVEPHNDGRVSDLVAGQVPFRLSVPGLDPGWSTSERRGEALLAAPIARVSPTDTDTGELLESGELPESGGEGPSISNADGGNSFS
ncbi:unannotated protein [freshwater metagenome]|uniref:Unannotated protein n=1 Tax=freshwater metagenome TaxID=449393 RepID=A0A6J6HYA8_9ZZZZ